MLEIMRVILVTLLSFASVATLAGQAAPTPDAIARALQDRYQGIRDFSGEFTQTYRSSAVPPDGGATTSALFLAGKGDIVRDFIPAFADSPIPGTLALELKPRRNDPDFEYLVVIIDPATLQIRGLTTRDRQGGESAITFLKLKENQGISDKEFVFRIPRGVDVVRTDDASN